MPVTPTHPGVYIEELSSGVRPVIGTATSIAAFVGYTARGVENQAVRLASFGDFERRFGGLDTESELGFAVQQYFRNGGTDAYVVRIPKSDAITASVTLKDSVAAGGATALALQASSSGAWGNALLVDLDHAGVTDASSFNLTITDPVSGNRERFSDLSIDPGSTRNAVVRLNDPARGSDLVSATAGASGAGRPAAAGTQGSDVFPLTAVDAAKSYRLNIQPDLPQSIPPASIPAPTPAVRPVEVEVLAVGERVPTSIGGLAALVARKVNSALRAADNAQGLAVNVVPSGSGLGLRIAGAVDAVKAKGALDAAFTVTPVTAAGTVADAAALLGLAGATANVGVYSPSGSARLALAATAKGTNGTALPTTGSIIGSEAQFTGIHALLKTDLFNLLCIPDATRAKPGSPTEVATGIDPAAVWTAALDLCQRRRAMLLIDPPPGIDTPDEAGDWISGLGAKSANSIAHFPRTRIADPTEEFQPRTIAPSGTIAGLIARTDAQRGVWKAPAGIDARLSGITGLDYVLSDAENGILNPLGLNSIRQFPVTGIVNWGARTTVGADELASEWKYVPVRRLSLFIEESLYRGTKWAVFEPNDEPLWSQLRLNIKAFMHDLFRKGAFAGTTPQEAYLVKCDSETTTPDDVNRGVVNVLVGFAPLKPAEFVIIRIQQLAGQTVA